MLDMGITPSMLVAAHEEAASARTRSLARKGDGRGDREKSAKPAGRARKSTVKTSTSSD
jgi:hypothetical protein